MYTCEYMHVYQEFQSVSTRKSINICELELHGFIYERICDIIYIYISCEQMYVYKEVLTVSTPKGKDICEFAKHRFIYNRIYDITYVYL